MDNPHEYDDEQFVNASNDLDEAVGSLWEAGASEDDIKGAFENALQNARQNTQA